MVSRVKQKRSAQQIVNGSNQRVTAQRSLLLQLLRRSEGHLDADEQYRRAREKQRRETERGFSFLPVLLQMECIGINNKEGSVNQDVISDGMQAEDFAIGGRRVTE